MYTYLYRMFVNILGMLNRGAVRSSIKFMKNEMESNGLVGAEVGVYLGRNSLMLLKNLDIKKLYLIDPYKNYKGKDGFSRNDFEIINKYAHKNLRKYNDRIVWIRDLSENAVKLIDDNSLDFVYIDGNHLYRWVKKDLELWYPKLKSDGFLCGHDFNRFDVARAVVEFSNKIGANIECGGFPTDWWMKKIIRLQKNKQIKN